MLPRQDNTAYTDASVGKGIHLFAHNDGDGSTGYDKAFSLQLGAVDSNFHESHELRQPPPFLELEGRLLRRSTGRLPMMTMFENQADEQGRITSPSLSQQLALVVRGRRRGVPLRVTNGSVDLYFTPHRLACR